MKIENLKKAVEINDTIEWVKASIKESIEGSLYGEDDVCPSHLSVVNAKLKKGFLQIQSEVISELIIELEKL